MIFPLVPLIFHSLGQSPNEMFSLRRAHVDFARACERAQFNLHKGEILPVRNRWEVVGDESSTKLTEMIIKTKERYTLSILSRSHNSKTGTWRWCARLFIELRARALGRVPAAHAQMTSPSCDTEQMAFCSPFLLGAP